MPNLDCRAIGWMDGYINSVHIHRNVYFIRHFVHFQRFCNFSSLFLFCVIVLLLLDIFGN
jgi:hypothetical protein